MQWNTVPLGTENVRLEPLDESHSEGLATAIADGELYRLYLTLVPAIECIPDFIDKAQRDYRAGDGITYAVRHIPSNSIVGSTRFMRAAAEHRRVEIGYTFIAASWQKTIVNTECKYLLLRHAFEEQKLLRVELLTDYLNNNSRRAIVRLGAKEEGVLRKHRIMPDGRIRDSVIYSITEDEWPGIKTHLKYKLLNSR